MYVVVGLLAIVAVSVVAGVVIVNRLETGEWKVPETGDFVRIVRRDDRPARTIYLTRTAVELRPGIDDAPRGVSSVLVSGANKPVTVGGWKGSAASWDKVVRCVRDLFAPFDVEVTDHRPKHEEFALVVVGGKSSDIGVKSKHVGGLAPFSGTVIARPVVFAFAGALRHDVRQVCETIGMEVAHAYGLDHGYECKDVMTYLPACGAKKFVDKDVRCGEKKPRTCEGGGTTQNSFRHLLGVLGARGQ